MNPLARVLPTALLATAALAAPAAAAPWSAPVDVPGSTNSNPMLAFAANGNGMLAWTHYLSLTPTGFNLTGARIGAGGLTEPAALTSGLVLDQLVPYGSGDGILASGSTTLDSKGRAAISFGSATGAFGKRQALPAGGHPAYVRATAANKAGDVAVVVSSCRPVESCEPATLLLFVKRHGHAFGKPVKLASGNHLRGGAVAINARGDVLAAWEDAHVIRSRTVTAGGTAGGIQRLGTGVQSSISAQLGPRREAIVAWGTQRVDEGDATSPFVADVAVRAAGHNFGRAVEIGSASPTGTGRYVGGAGVTTSALTGGVATVDYTAYDGADYVVRSRDITVSTRTIGTAQTLSPAGTDSILASSASGPDGEQVAVWLTGRRGSDPVSTDGAATPTGVQASVRALGQPWGAPEDLGQSSYIETADVAINPVSGNVWAVWPTLSGLASIVVRTPVGGE